MKTIAPFGPIGPIGLHVQELVVVEKKLKLENVSFLIVQDWKKSDCFAQEMKKLQRIVIEKPVLHLVPGQNGVNVQNLVEVELGPKKDNVLIEGTHKEILAIKICWRQKNVMKDHVLFGLNGLTGHLVQ